MVDFLCKQSGWTAIGASGTLIIALVWLRRYWADKYWNYYTYFSDFGAQIIQIGMKEPDFLNAAKTKAYITNWGRNEIKRVQYETYARACWSHAYAIYSGAFGYRKKFIRLHVPIFEDYRRLHSAWFENNAFQFADKKFVRFVNKCLWRRRKYVDARTADLLRWNYEVDDYEQKILHPFLEGVQNPMIGYIRSLQQTGLVVADLGCGCGKGGLLKLLSESDNIATIYAVDYSDNMLQMAREAFPNNPRIMFKKLDMTNLSELYGKLDIAFSVNSILPREPRDTARILTEIHEALRENGKFVAILPSFDTVLHLMKLEFGQECRRLARLTEKDRKIGEWPLELIRLLRAFPIALYRVCYKEFWKERRLRPWPYRLYADDCANVQRFIHRKDITHLLAKARLRATQDPLRVEYPWELSQKFNYGYHPNQTKVWDWFIVAERSD